VHVCITRCFVGKFLRGVFSIRLTVLLRRRPQFDTRLVLVAFVIDEALTPWSRVLPDKPIITQLVKKFRALYGNGRFITVFTTARHCPCPEPDASNPRLHTLFLSDPFYM